MVSRPRERDGEGSNAALWAWMRWGKMEWRSGAREPKTSTALPRLSEHALTPDSEAALPVLSAAS
jgi:hypothetical protein